MSLVDKVQVLPSMVGQVGLQWTVGFFVGVAALAWTVAVVALEKQHRRTGTVQSEHWLAWINRGVGSPPKAVAAAVISALLIRLCGWMLSHAFYDQLDVLQVVADCSGLAVNGSLLLAVYYRAVWPPLVLFPAALTGWPWLLATFWSLCLVQPVHLLRASPVTFCSACAGSPRRLWASLYRLGRTCCCTIPRVLFTLTTSSDSQGHGIWFWHRQTTTTKVDTPTGMSFHETPLPTTAAAVDTLVHHSQGFDLDAPSRRLSRGGRFRRPWQKQPVGRPGWDCVDDDLDLDQTELDTSGRGGGGDGYEADTEGEDPYLQASAIWVQDSEPSVAGTRVPTKSTGSGGGGAYEDCPVSRQQRQLEEQFLEPRESQSAVPTTTEQLDRKYWIALNHNVDGSTDLVFSPQTPACCLVLPLWLWLLMIGLCSLVELGKQAALQGTAPSYVLWGLHHSLDLALTCTPGLVLLERIVFYWRPRHNYNLYKGVGPPAWPFRKRLPVWLTRRQTRYAGLTDITTHRVTLVQEEQKETRESGLAKAGEPVDRLDDAESLRTTEERLPMTHALVIPTSDEDEDLGDGFAQGEEPLTVVYLTPQEGVVPAG